MTILKRRAAWTALAAVSLAAALAGGVGASAAKASPAVSADTTGSCPPSGAAWSTTNRETDYQHGQFDLNSDEWNPAGGNGAPASWMTTWAGSDSRWGVCANEPGNGWPYPDERIYLPDTPMSSLSAINSGYSDSTPSDGQYDSAYDIWLKRPSSAPGKTPPEVMIWTTNHGEWTGNRQVVGRMAIGGHQYRMSVCAKCNRVSFVFPSNVPATTVNILAVLRYAAQNPASRKILGTDPAITEIDRGWEIYKTNGTQPFTANSYWLSVRQR